MRLKAFKFRLYPKTTQAIDIKKACGSRRFIYNWGLNLKTTEYQKGNKLSAIDLANKLPELKLELPWLKDINSQSLQNTLRDLDIAFTRFFKKQAKFPTFKKKHKSKESFHVPQHFKINQYEKFILIPKVGKIKTVFHQEVIGTPKSITVSMSKSGKFYASILCEQDINDPEPKILNVDKTIGIDVGIKPYAVVSDGQRFENPKNLKKSISKVKYLDKQHSKKLKGGKNKEKARQKLALAHEKVVNQRNDFIHKTTNTIINENQVNTICIEDLNVQGMMKNHKLSQSIGDCSWGEFFRQLKYKSVWRGVRVVEIGRFDPSSKLCSCGYKNNDLKQGVKEWTCIKCNKTHDRDLLAAQNIRRFGVAKMLLTAGGMPVESLGSCPVVMGSDEPRSHHL